MQFVHIIVDFFVLGILSLFSTVTIGLWYIFVDSFILKRGYLAFINKYTMLKAILIFITGVLIWGSAIVGIHRMLWTQ